MNPRTTGILLLATLALGAILYFEVGGEDARLEREQRSKRLFQGFEPADVTWIALRTSDGVDARFEKRDQKWQLTQPFQFPADPAVERLADELATATSEATFEHPQPDAEYGLDDASARIVRFAVGDHEHELRIGKATPVGSNVYVRTGDAPAVHTIAGYRATGFTRSLADLRNKQILAFDSSAIREVEVRWPGARAVLARGAPPDTGNEVTTDSKGDWQMTTPVATRADGDAVDALLATLAYLRADGFVDEPTAEQRKLFDPADFEIALRGADAQAAPIPLTVSRPDKADKRLVRAGGNVLFEIPAARIADFPRTISAYRDRHLATFPVADAAHIDFFFHSPDGDPVAIRAERAADGSWSSTPESFATGMLTSVVSELSRLEATDILAESMGERELEKLGLSPPRTIVTVFGAAPPPAAGAAPDALPPAPPRLAEVQFGDLTSDGVVARAAGSPIVYRVNLVTAERLPVSLQSFHNRFQAQPEAAAPAAAPDADAGPAGEPGMPAEESP